MLGLPRPWQQRLRLAVLLQLGFVSTVGAASGEPSYPRCVKMAGCAHSLQAAAESWTAGRVELALTNWQSAYELSREPHLLLRIAQAYEKLQQSELAFESYKLFMQQAPDAPEQDFVLHRVRALLEAQSPSDATPPARPPLLVPGTETASNLAPTPSCTSAAAHSKPKLIAGYTVLGLSSVALIVSGVLLAEDGKLSSSSGCLEGARAVPCQNDFSSGYIAGFTLSAASAMAGSLLLTSGYKRAETKQGESACAKIH